MYTYCSSEISFLDFSGASAVGWSLNLPESIMVEKMFPLSTDQWVLISKDSPEIDR